jgi:hypothetical protein
VDLDVSGDEGKEAGGIETMEEGRGKRKKTAQKRGNLYFYSEAHYLCDTDNNLIYYNLACSVFKARLILPDPTLSDRRRNT